MTANLQQMTALITLVQTHQTDISHLEKPQARTDTADLIKSLRIAVTNAESDDDKVEAAPTNEKKKIEEQE